MANLRISVGAKAWTIEVGPQRSLLDSVLSHGIPVSYACKRSDCLQCAVSVISGSAVPLEPSRASLIDGKLLLCNALAREDLVVEVPYLLELDGIEVRRIACKIHELKHLSRDVIQVSFRLPPTADFRHVPGQYIRLINKDRITRSYSLVATSHQPRLLHIHVRRIEGGAFSDYLFEAARIGDLLQIEGPMGHFVLRSDIVVAKSVFFATGTGIAPIYAMLSSMSPAQRERCGRVYLYWGNRDPVDAYWTKEVGELARLVDLEHHFVYSRRPGSDGAGDARHVQDVMALHHKSLADAQLFASGNPAMIEDGRRRAIALNLPPGRFFADPFTPS